MFNPVHIEKSDAATDARHSTAESTFVTVAVIAGIRTAILQETIRNQACILAQRQFDLIGRIRVVAQEGLGIFTPLPETLTVVGEPGTRLFDDAGLYAEVDKLAGLGNAFTIHDVEFDLLEGRRHLVLDDLDARLVADNLFAFLDSANTADVEANGGVELERVTAGRRFRRTEHDANLHTDLVDEDDHAFRLGDRSGQLAQRLAHQTRLKTRQAITHLAFDFRPRRQRRNGVDHEHVNRAGAHQRIGDLKRLLARIRLRDQQALQIHAKLAGIDRIKRMFGIDEGADAALLLGFRNGLQRQRRFTRAFRTINFNDTPLRQTADAERDIQAERARRNGFHFNHIFIGTELHDRSLAERPFDLGERRFQCLAFIHRFILYETQRILCHPNHL
ncbi:hypothetical protein AT6N2_C0285 [Agrobacterium tumefaciens]|nr:hypothetical protein AT6N2_C0285 [Agrobacterium tumefaciens]